MTCPHKRLTQIMVGFFTTEATIKIKDFRWRRAHSNGKTTNVFGNGRWQPNSYFMRAKGQNLGPANPTRNPNPTWNNAFCSVHAMAENAEKLVVFCRFQSNEFQCTKHHRHKPDTKQHENITRSALNPTWNHKPNVKQRLLGPSLHWGPQIPPQCHPTRNTPDMKQRHLWGDFQLQQLSRLQARDVPATCSNNVVSCGVWFHRGFVVLWKICKHSPRARFWVGPHWVGPRALPD